MKPETRLNKILDMEDGAVKLSKLYSLSWNVLYGCPLSLRAQAEIKRLQELGYSLRDICPHYA